MSDNTQTCDFCGCPFEWTDHQIVLNFKLRLRGSGLGACCPACDEKFVQIAIREERLERRRECARERRARR